MSSVIDLKPNSLLQLIKEYTKFDGSTIKKMLEFEKELDSNWFANLKTNEDSIPNYNWNIYSRHLIAIKIFQEITVF